MNDAPEYADTHYTYRTTTSGNVVTETTTIEHDTVAKFCLSHYGQEDVSEFNVLVELIAIDGQKPPAEVVQPPAPPPVDPEPVADAPASPTAAPAAPTHGKVSLGSSKGKK